MIDTARLSSPYLTDGDADRIEQACVRRLAYQIATGEEQYSLTTGSLEGSFDARVSVRVEREEWVVGPVVARRQTRPSVTKQECAPYLVIEGSVHKALLGHNVFGGPLPPALSLAWFVDYAAGLLGVTLPYAEEWRVDRIDWAEVYELPSYEAVQEYISGLNMAEYPRRKVLRFGSESLMAAGDMTAVKVYHKGPEFYKHDRKRLRDHLSAEDLLALQDRANRILRLETEVKARKLTDAFKGRKPLAYEVTREFLEETHDREVARLLREGQSEMETVRTHREVSRRLHDRYEARLANTLLGTWMQLAALGETEVRKSVSRATYFRQKKQLVEAGVAWNGADVYIARHSAIPAGFTPTRRDPHRLTEEADRVIQQLYVEYQRPMPK